MKHEWKKNEKQYYQPKNRPELVNIPNFKFFTIDGQGNPNDEFFGEYISVLYSLSYTVKMSPKKGFTPHGYFDYTIYPLEGVWDLTDEARKTYSGTINKNDLVFKLMIRQPDFISTEFARMVLEMVNKKSPHLLLEKIRFEEMAEGNVFKCCMKAAMIMNPQVLK